MTQVVPGKSQQARIKTASDLHFLQALASSRFLMILTFVHEYNYLKYDGT